MALQYDNRDKMKATDRILVLKIIDGTKPKTTTGLIDPDLFKGNNRLHVVKEPDTNFWYFKQDKGILAPALRQKFTTFLYAKEYATNYFKTRNIEVKEVID